MPRLPRKSFRLGNRLDELKNMADLLRAELQTQFKDVIQNPRRLSTLLEEKSPWLGEQVRKEILTAASNLSDPFLVGMGLKVLKMSEDSIEVGLPQRWKNSEGSGAIHVGALCTAAEFTSRVYWERHLSPTWCESRVVNIQANFLRPALRDTKAVYHVGDTEREALLFQVRSEKSINFESLVAVYDSEKQLISEVTIEWNFRRKQTIGVSKQSVDDPDDEITDKKNAKKKQ